jgi:hypothetical protein
MTLRSKIILVSAISWVVAIGGYSVYLGAELGLPLSQYTFDDITHLALVSMAPPVICFFVLHAIFWVKAKNQK